MKSRKIKLCKSSMPIAFVILGIFGYFASSGYSTAPASSEIVQLSKCTDGDTAHFLIDGEDKTARFLAIDTPETKHPTKGVEPYGNEASEYTCSTLQNAKEITLEYDPNSEPSDKYKRELVWVFVDGELLQKQLIAQGLAKVDYLYGDYRYTDELLQAQEVAKEQKLGIWK